jgi:hypothetical protein
LVRGERLVHIPDFLAVASRSGSPASRGVPKVRALFEATLFAGLRKAGMPEE